MRAILFAAAAVLIPTVSSAADMPVKARPVPTAVYNWTGWYVGVNAGYSTQDNHVSLGADPLQIDFLNDPTRTFGPPFPFDTRTSGFLGGVQAGANYQVSPLWVFGVEADIQGGNVRGRYSNTSSVPIEDAGQPPPTPPATFTSVNEYEKKLVYLGTVRGRVGWLATPNLLFYATGGLAYGEVDTSAVANVFVTNSQFGGGTRTSINDGTNSETKVGWTAGIGGEWRFSGNWSLKGEYLYYDLGATTVNAFFRGVAIAPLYFSFSSRVDGHLARLGLNYSFNSPVVAKY